MNPTFLYKCFVFSFYVECAVGIITIIIERPEYHIPFNFGSIVIQGLLVLSMKE